MKLENVCRYFVLYLCQIIEGKSNLYVANKAIVSFTSLINAATKILCFYEWLQKYTSYPIL